MYLFKIFFFCLFFSACSFYTNAESVPRFDSSAVAARIPPVEKQSEIFSDSDYRYDKRSAPGYSWWDRFWMWVRDVMDSLFSTRSGSLFLTVFKWMLIVSLTVLIIWLLLKNEVRSLFFRKNVSADLEFEELTADIHRVDFDRMIQEAVQEKNFRRAVRLYFLQTLKLLSDKNLIKWKPEKTNYDYYLELREKPFHPDFRSISILYDYVWYGDFQIGEKDFLSASRQFGKFTGYLTH
jgi:hypothetical protein